MWFKKFVTYGFLLIKKLNIPLPSKYSQFCQTIFSLKICNITLWNG
jgi:hypothetical protein